ncbi:hypothetical protein ASU31_10595 [Pedobacter ginsenosidimutans]|uniref:Uncharacterized protein n=1 Tax=Pedobacter ginsenosidimutans TaxID=687842 RepID=A0A0T5VQ53_9SPHI|nr:hypothetical protein [Pedobacter ginsenosidimutans]KRT15949.1 hypothetical protein ASU31_10595 [Pedobacter ginsenosidimutans]
MKLFRKYSRPLSDGQERFAFRIAGRILAVQRQLSGWLNAKTADLHPKTWLFLLVCFCAGFGAYLIHLVMQTFN